jgi:hypothetical protein
MLSQTQLNHHRIILTIIDHNSNNNSDLSTEVAPEEDIERARIKSLLDPN